MTKMPLAIVLSLVSITPSFADNLQSIPQTHTERWYVAVFCNASIAATVSDAELARVGAWIAKYKPDIDCAKETDPSLVAVTPPGPTK